MQLKIGGVLGAMSKTVGGSHEKNTFQSKARRWRLGCRRLLSGGHRKSNGFIDCMTEELCSECAECKAHVRNAELIKEVNDE